MRKKSDNFVAEGGLLDRRTFWKRAATMGMATAGMSAGPHVQAAAQIPHWMRELGQPDQPYGQPALQEQAVQRVKHAAPAPTAGFSVWRTPLQHQRGIITPSGLHFAVHHNGMPVIDPGQHVLMLHGMVRQPLRFDLERLMRYPMRSQVHFLECAGNSAANALSPWAMDLPLGELAGEVSCAEWTGIPMRYLLDEAGPQEGARWVIAEGADGGSHSRSLPLAAVREHGLLALYQNGERLRPSQGYPMRLFMPGWEGNVNVKWLHRLELSDVPAFTKDESGLYTQALADGSLERMAFVMEVKSLITHPSGQQVLPQPYGFYEVSGLAWSGRGTVAGVEVSADGGRTWAAAQLDGPVLDRAFTRFVMPWQWNGREATLVSRARDSTGQVQPLRSAWKRRYAMHSFNHYNAVQAWRVRTDGRVENAYV